MLMAVSTLSACDDAYQLETEGMAALREQMEVVTLDVEKYAFRRTLVTFEHPFFSMAHERGVVTRDYKLKNKHGDVFIDVTSSHHGMPTVYDQDVLVFCLSQLAAMQKQGEPISQLVRFTGYSILTALGWSTGGKDYERLRDALDRLRGMEIKTNIPSEKNSTERLVKTFTLITDWGAKVHADTGHMEYIEVGLSRWLFAAAVTGNLKSVHEGYFRLTPLAKRVYELCRKHCGEQAKWEISVKQLHHKSGSGSLLKVFRSRLKALCADENFPGYSLAYRPDDFLVVTPKPNAPKAMVGRSPTIVAAKPVISLTRAKSAATAPANADASHWAATWEPRPGERRNLDAVYSAENGHDIPAALEAYRLVMVGKPRPANVCADFKEWYDAQRMSGKARG
jgi:plasmid replication initiation protein